MSPADERPGAGRGGVRLVDDMVLWIPSCCDFKTKLQEFQ